MVLESAHMVLVVTSDVLLSALCFIFSQEGEVVARIYDRTGVY